MNSDSPENPLQDIKKEYKNVEKIAKITAFVPKRSVSEMVKELLIFWVNPRITDQSYPIKDSFVGEWEIEVLRPKNTLKFDEIVRLCTEDGYSPATIFHLLSFVSTAKNTIQYKSLLAPASLCVDDFEYIGCVALGVEKEDLKLGLGNWRGSKIGGYDILRVKKVL